MKPSHFFAYSAATLCLTASSASRPFASILKQFQLLSDQAPLAPSPVNAIMPPASDQISTGVIISDVIGKTQTIAIFSGLTRDIDSVAERLDTASQNATVLAPDNTVMRGLKRKPWEDAEDYSTFGKTAYDGAVGEDRAHKNLRTFVESHIVPHSPWEEGRKAKTLAGNEIWYEIKDGKKKVCSLHTVSQEASLQVIQIQPFDVEVISIADKVSNGEVWVIGGSLR